MCALPRGESWNLEAAARVGVAAGLLAVLTAANGPHPAVAGYAAISPADLTAWVTAVCSVVGAIAAAANGVAIVVHRWGRKPRQRHPRKRDAGPPPPAP